MPDDAVRQVMLTQSADADGRPQGESLQPDIPTNIMAALDELRTTGEELRRENDELIQARQALEAERQRYLELFESAPDGYLVTDDRGIIQEANRAASELLQVQHQFLVGKPLALFVAPEDHPALYSWLKLLDREMGQRGEMLIQRRNGEMMPVSMTVAATPNGQGRLSTLRWLLRDITQHKREEARLRASQARFAGLVSIFDDALITIDEALHITLLNSRVEKIFGYGIEELVGQPLDILWPERLAQVQHKQIRDFIAGHESLRSMNDWGPVLGRRKDGSEFPAEASIAKFEAAGERVLTIRMRDVTERLRVEEELRVSRDQLAIILQGAADGITAQDASGNVIYANQAAARLMGYATADELMATPRDELMHKFKILDEAGRPFPLDQLPGRLALRGVAGSSVTIRFRIKATGEERWSVVKATPVRNAQDQVDYAVNMFQDITDLKRTAQTQQLLAEVSRVLVASLDYSTRLGSVVRALVPNLADWCVLDVIEEDPSIHHLAAAHVEPAKVKLARGLRLHYPTRPDASESEIYGEVSDEQLEAWAQDEEQLALLRELRIKSAMVVPCMARGRMLGAMTLVRTDSGQRYSPGDLAVAEEIARRVALAVDNARLFREAQQLNAQLEQRVMERTTELRASNAELEKQVADRLQAEEHIRVLNADLEQRVVERTMQVEAVNRELKREVAERKQAEEALWSALAKTQELYEISRHIGMVHTSDDVLQALLSSSYLQRASRASVAIFERPWDEGGERPECCQILTAWNAHAELPTFVGNRFTLEEYGMVEPFSRSRPGYIEDIHTDPRMRERIRRRFLKLKTRSLILFPLVAVGQWYGLLEFHWETRKTLSEGELRHIQGLVDQAATAIYNMRLLQTEAQARQEAEKANVLKLRFLAMISHELRTPLTSIKGFATTLLAEDVTWEPAVQRDFIKTIDQEADKLTDLIEQLLDLSRLDAGTLRISPEAERMSSVVAMALPDLTTATSKHKLTLQIPDDLPRVRADVQRIAQVLTNLVGNAAKYSPAGTEIGVSASADHQHVQVNVTDHGPGIPLEERAHVFEAFHRVDNAAHNQVKGAGLGLAICKGLVEAHGGSIWIEDRPGPGTTMSFTLPIAEPTEGQEEG